ncbi:hypothetical protein NCGM2209_1592 [Mycobacterium tuberculosis NCGM2209]|nr:hypothetical protein NCGM2209_1592 [Mycobacterium tuberculosis NCGM2209]
MVRPGRAGAGQPAIQRLLAELAGAHQHTRHAHRLGGQHVVVQIVADHDHLLWIDTDAVGGRQESLGRRLADGGGGLAAGLFHSGQVHPGVDAQPVGGVPGHIAVHRHHRNAVEHPPIDPAERAVIELGAGHCRARRRRGLRGNPRDRSRSTRRRRCRASPR